MNNILAVLLTSSLISAVVTWFLNLYISNQNYKREYYKQIVIKRLKAYESVETVLQILGGNAITQDGKNIPRAFWSRESYVEFLAILISSIAQTVWLSHEVTQILENINVSMTVAGVEHSLHLQREGDPHFAKAGLEIQAKLDEYKSELFHQLRTDFLKLHDIEAFNKV